MNNTITITCHYDQLKLTLKKSCYICCMLFQCTIAGFTLEKDYKYDDNDEFCKIMFEPAVQTCAIGQAFSQCHYYNHGCNRCEGNKNE